MAPGTGSLRSLGVILTSGCNLACSYCYQNDRERRRMSPEVVRAAVDLVMQSRRRVVTLALIGGEPLLDFRLFKEAVEYAERVRTRGKRIRFVTSTNGTLLERERVGFLAAHRVRTQISCDGVREAQEMRCGGTFEVLDRLLDRLRKDHPDFLRDRVTVALTLMSSTIPLLARSVRYLVRKRVRKIAVTPITTHDPTWTKESIHDLDREMGRVFRTCLSHYRLTGEVPLLLFRRRARDRPCRPRGIQMCGVGTGEALAVDVNGEVHGCVAFASSYQSPPAFLQRRFDSMQLGDLRDATFPERLARYHEATRAARIFDDKQDKHSSYGKCGECRCLASCAVCPVSIGNIPGNADPDRIPDSVCAWNRVTLRYRERFPVQAGAFDILSGRASVPRMMRDLLAAANGRRKKAARTRA